MSAPDGVPHPPTPEEIAELAKVNPMLAALASANAPPPEGKEVIEKVTLTDTEAGVLLGLSVAAAQIQNETQGYIANAICARLGIHQSLTLQFHAKEKWITVRKEAPKV